ncbi:MAG: GNAT family N-acetyltransferase [Ruminococcus sp.]|nr:GNAT family N-acetyltransferase [Ruminococcus sp.]
MNVVLKKINKSSDDFKRAKRLYLRAFPANERAPFWILSSKAKKSYVDFLGIYCKDKLVGLMYVVCYKSACYIFYFAVSDKLRNKGFGSAALKQVKKKYSDYTLFLAIEPIEANAANLDERKNRREFYIKNGFNPTNLRIREGKMIYEVLSNGKVDPDNYTALMRRYISPLPSCMFSIFHV